MKIKMTQSNQNSRLDVYLSQYLNCSRSKIASYIDSCSVTVNGRTQKSSYKLKENDIVEFSNEEFECFTSLKTVVEPYDFKLDIKYEDDYLLVINKPKGLVVHPTKYEQTDTLANALVYHCGKNLSDISGLSRPGIVHRLDKDTSGLMIAAKNNDVHENLAQQIKTKTLKRKYFAIVKGNFEEDQGVINEPLLHYLKDDVKMTVAPDGLEAITCYKVIKRFKEYSLVELELKTGRTHQIRCHLAFIGHPVFGDKLYGGFVPKIKTQGQLLQSYSISFEHPQTKERMTFELNESEFSEDFIKVLKILRSNDNERN